MLKFGDTFKYREKDYVYLAKTEEITYAAEILDENKSKLLNRIHDRQISNGAKTERILNMPLYCFVILKTEPFQGRAAHFHSTGKGDTVDNEYAIFEPTKSLEKIDLKEILNEIKEGPVPKELKQLTEGIEIQCS